MPRYLVLGEADDDLVRRAARLMAAALSPDLDDGPHCPLHEEALAVAEGLAHLIRSDLEVAIPDGLSPEAAAGVINLLATAAARVAAATPGLSMADMPGRLAAAMLAAHPAG